MQDLPVSGALITNQANLFLLVQDRRTDKYGLVKGKLAED